MQEECRVSQIRTSELEDQLDDRMAELRSSVATVQDLQTRLGRSRNTPTCSHTSLGKETLPEAAMNMVTCNHHSLASLHQYIYTTLSEILCSGAIDVASILLEPLSLSEADNSQVCMTVQVRRGLRVFYLTAMTTTWWVSGELMKSRTVSCHTATSAAF